MFIKPHAVTAPTKKLATESLAKVGISIVGEGELTADVIEQKKLIDNHYYAIANKASLSKPAELNPPALLVGYSFGGVLAPYLRDALAAREGQGLLQPCILPQTRILQHRHLARLRMPICKRRTQHALLRLPVGRRQARAPPILSNRAADHADA